MVLEHDPWIGATLKKQATADAIVTINVKYDCGPDLCQCSHTGDTTDHFISKTIDFSVISTNFAGKEKVPLCQLGGFFQQHSSFALSKCRKGV